MMVELHSRTCSCHGGSWMSIAGRSGSPCSKDGSVPPGAVVVPLEQWRAMGKPHNVEEFQEFLSQLSRLDDRREHQRFERVLDVRLSSTTEREAPPCEAETDNVSRGGARVRSRLVASKGDVLLFEDRQGRFRTRAQVRDVRAAGDRDFHVLHLHFLDEQAPDALLAT